MAHKKHRPKALSKRASQAPDTRRPPRGTMWGRWAAAAFGFAWFLWQFDTIVPGPSTLWPTHIDWLMRPDWDQHYLGSCFARLSGANLFDNSLPKLLPGLDTTVGLVDANPWLTAILKLLHPILPVHFQLMGLWLCLGFVVQGYMGARIAALWGASERVQALSGALLATAPVLLQRVGHDTLCVHWVIVAMLWCLLKSAQTRGARRYAFFIPSALMLFVSGLHPYLGGMLAPLYGVSLAQAVVLSPTGRQWLEAGLMGLATTLACYGLAVWAGFLGTDASAQGELFGFYSANMLTLFDPSGWSSSLKAWPQVPMQYEGFGFLGLGGLVLVLAGVALGTRRATHSYARGLWCAVAVVAAVETVYAIGPRMMLGDRLLADWTALAEPIMPYLSVFRCSGRFIWVAHYALWVWALGLCLTRMPRAWHGPVVAGLLVAQVWDMKPVGVVLQRTRPSHTTPPLTDPAWRSLSGYKNLVMVPPSFTMHERACPMQPLPIGTWPQMAKIAYENGLTFNSASLSRANEDAIRAYCTTLEQTLAAGDFKKDTAYAVRETYLHYFDAPARGMTCTKANQWYLCRHSSGGHDEAPAVDGQTHAAAL